MSVKLLGSTAFISIMYCGFFAHSLNATAEGLTGVPPEFAKEKLSPKLTRFILVSNWVGIMIFVNIWLSGYYYGG